MFPRLGQKADSRAVQSLTEAILSHIDIIYHFVFLSNTLYTILYIFILSCQIYLTFSLVFNFLNIKQLHLPTKQTFFKLYRKCITEYYTQKVQRYHRTQKPLRKALWGLQGQFSRYGQIRVKCFCIVYYTLYILHSFFIVNHDLFVQFVFSYILRVNTPFLPLKSSELFFPYFCNFYLLHKISVLPIKYRIFLTFCGKMKD